MHLEIAERQIGAVTVLDLVGKLTIDQDAQRLKDKINSLILQQRTAVVLNLGGVSYIDSGGLGTLVGVYSLARAGGADIKLTGLGQRLRDVLQITKLVTVFEVYDTEQEAVATFHRGAA